MVDSAVKDEDQVTHSTVEKVRQSMCEYVVKDLSSRYVEFNRKPLSIVELRSRTQFANIWMNEEWYNDQIQRTENPRRVTHLATARAYRSDV